MAFELGAKEKKLDPDVHCLFIVSHTNAVGRGVVVFVGKRSHKIMWHMAWENNFLFEEIMTFDL